MIYVICSILSHKCRYKLNSLRIWITFPNNARIIFHMMIFAYYYCYLLTQSFCVLRSFEISV